MAINQGYVDGQGNIHSDIHWPDGDSISDDERRYRRDCEMATLRAINAELLHMLEVAEAHLEWGDCTLDLLHRDIRALVAKAKE